MYSHWREQQRELAHEHAWDAGMPQVADSFADHYADDACDIELKHAPDLKRELFDWARQRGLRLPVKK